jgi:hypothetical protein
LPQRGVQSATRASAAAPIPVDIPGGYAVRAAHLRTEATTSSPLSAGSKRYRSFFGFSCAYPLFIFIRRLYSYFASENRKSCSAAVAAALTAFFKPGFADDGLVLPHCRNCNPDMKKDTAQPTGRNVQ